MMKYLYLLIGLMFLSGIQAVAQDRKVRSFDRSGNSQYEEQHYQEAEMDYRRALNINPKDSVARFNLATSLIRQQDQAKLAEADSLLTGLIMEAEQTGNRQLSARSLYQKGEIGMMAQQFAQAASFFKESLKRNPNDHDARYNYLLAMKLLKQQEQQQQDQNKDQDKDQKQDKKQEQQKQEQQQQEQQQNQDQKQDQQQEQQQQEQQQQMSEDQRQAILEQNEREERETQAKVMRRQQEKDDEKKREMEIKRMNGTLKDW
ncbi:MAG: hypothetical protein J6Y99_06130 [Bacteroidales bacterium]|nr:hypothetical protein [Bacteroidales bacterium]